MTLVEFLQARISEDEALAERSVQIGDKGATLVSFSKPDTAPVLIMSPDRVLAECASKRRIVERAKQPVAHAGQSIERTAALEDLAAVYADHPDYREDWRP